LLLNDHKNLRDWINDPQVAKPGCFMPSMKLAAPELDQVTAYLESLH
jgi:cytochrome c1